MYIVLHTLGELTSWSIPSFKSKSAGVFYEEGHRPIDGVAGLLQNLTHILRDGTGNYIKWIGHCLISTQFVGLLIDTDTDYFCNCRFFRTRLGKDFFGLG